MASIAEVEVGCEGEHQRHVLLRLLDYVRPYGSLVVLTLVLTVGLSGSRYLRAYLVKPAMDNVVVPHVHLSGSKGSREWLPNLPIPGLSRAPEAVTAPPTMDEETRQALRQSIDRSLAQILMVAIAVVITIPVLRFCRSYLVEWILSRIYLDIEQGVCAKLLALPLRFHADRHRGDVLSRTMRDVGSAHDALNLVFSDLITSVFTVIVGVVCLFLISWQLALVALLIGPGFTAIITLFAKRIRRSARRRQESFGNVTQHLMEILGGIKVIKAFCAEQLEHAAFRSRMWELFRRSMKAVRYRVLTASLVETTNDLAVTGLLVLALLAIREGRMGLTPGDLAAFFAVLATAYKPTKSLAKGWVKLLDAQPGAERFFEVLDTPVEIHDAPNAVQIDGVHQGVRVRGVTFSYGREPVLRDVSFEARAGEVVAIVGRTGAGKSTLVDLILRFHDPQAGSIEIDGVDIRNIERSSLLAHMAVVSQEPFLFDGSIGDNIRYGRPGASDEEVMAAARAAHVEEFVSQLPEGYDTEVGALGVRLSGGQRQRITIARALLRDPAILIFDEATSSLDSKSERLVQDAIETLFGGRTVFTIAHRLSTIRRADRIVVLEGGRVTQVGSHGDLVARGGLYRELLELQQSEKLAHRPAGSGEPTLGRAGAT